MESVKTAEDGAGPSFGEVKTCSVVEENRGLHIGRVFQTSLSVIDALFRWMTTRELYRSKRVCKTWQKYVQRVLSKRYAVETVAGTYSRNADLSECRVPLAIFRKTEITTEPLLWLTFCWRDFDCIFGSSSHNSCLLKSALPPKCCVLRAVCEEGSYGIPSGEPVGNSPKVLLPDNALSGYIFGAALLSRPDICIRKILIPKGVFQKDEPKDRNSFCQRFDWPSEIDVKFVVLLATLDSYNVEAMHFVQCMSKFPEGPEIAITGGAVDVLNHRNCMEDSTLNLNMVAILFGGSGVRATSLLLEPSRRRIRSVVQDIMQAWKEATVERWPPTDNIGFIFQCCGLHAKHKELYAFRKVFPDVPLCGLQTRGEYGCDAPTVTRVDITARKTRKRSVIFGDVNGEDEICRTFHSSFGIIGFIRQ